MFGVCAAVAVGGAGWRCKRLRFQTRAAKELCAAGLFLVGGLVGAVALAETAAFFWRTMVTLWFSWGTATLIVVVALRRLTGNGRSKAEGAGSSSAEEHSSSDCAAMSSSSAVVMVSGVTWGALRFCPLRSSMPAPHSKPRGGSGHEGLGTLS